MTSPTDIILYYTGTVGPRIGIFLSPLDANDGFYLSHIPVPARGKDKNEQPHLGHWSICDVIVMLKLNHHVVSQHIQDFLEVFLMFSQYKMGVFSGE